MLSRFASTLARSATTRAAPAAAVVGAYNAAARRTATSSVAAPAAETNIKAFQLYRYNPDTDAEPTTEEFKVDMDDCGPMVGWRSVAPFYSRSFVYSTNHFATPRLQSIIMISVL
jgi:hypothetical protein